ncbi:MAG: amino acid adenylation domain-containing protein, partial [Holophagales bacterium]|nr:amino acid adenylation domain-containing protein [Holophagales bacterium]
MARDSGSELVLTVSANLELMERAAGSSAELGGLRCWASDTVEPTLASFWNEPDIDEHSLAFLQYTSGSTASPKGVMVSHGNLVHNQLVIREALQMPASSVVVSWLPMYHDMGLIGTMMQPLFVGGQAVLMSPVSFLRQPIRWLRAISEFRAGIGCSPNFGYDLCVDKIADDDLEGLDLGGWRVALNGAEPVRHGTLERFSRRFAACGFDPRAFQPCYGMAETTLMVTSKRATRPPYTKTVQRRELEQGRIVGCAPGDPEGQTLVSSGRAVLDQRVEIVDPDSRRSLPAGRVGEIWVAGPSVTAGYWQLADATEVSFGARTTEGDGPFLRTGDLGFVDGEDVFVTGRLKDVIILRGRCIYPQDIALTVETSDPDLRAGCGAAFSIDAGGEERLVIVQEVERQARKRVNRETLDRIRAAVAAEHAVQVHDIVLVLPGRVPKTSSGKLQRHACRRAYLAGEMASLCDVEAAEPAPPSAEQLDRTALLDMPEGRRARYLRAFLRSQLAAVLKVEEDSLDLRRRLASFGLDSLASIQLVAVVEQRLRVELPIEDLFAAEATLETVGDRILTLLKSEPRQATAPLAEADPAARFESFPLTDIQQAYLVGRSQAMELGGIGCQLTFEVDAVDLDLRRLEAALNRLVCHHDMLRCVIVDPTRQQVLERVEPYRIEVSDLRGAEAEHRERRLEEIRSQLEEHIFDADRWPLFRVCASRLDDRRTRLHASFDLLMVDASSLVRLLAQWSQLYRDPEAGLPVQRATFRDYLLAERRSRDSEAYRRSERYWRERSERLVSPSLPLAKEPRQIERPRFVRRQARLSGEVWERLQARGRKAGATPSSLLCAAFAEVLARWNRGRRPTLNLTVFDHRRLVPGARDLLGELTSTLLLDTDAAGRSFGERVAAVSRRLREDLHHLRYGGLRVLEGLRQLPETADTTMPVVFTSLLGHGDGGDPLAWLGETVHAISRTPQVWLDHQVYQIDDELVLAWDAVEELFPQGLLDDLFGVYVALLERLAEDGEAWDAPSLDLLPEPQRRQREEVNGTAAPVPHGTLLDLFDQRLAALGAAGELDRPAVIEADSRLTYGELDPLVSGLASRLADLGAGRGQLVAVVLEKGRAQVMAVLGILRSGAGYLPIDPEWPAERIHYLLANAQAGLVVTDRRLADELPWPPEIRCQCIEDIRPRPEPPACEPPRPEDLAYVIYTSGSTGKPKGVMITHRAVVNTVVDLGRRFAVGPDDRVLALSALTFDLSVYDIFGLLAAGGAVVMPRPERRQDPSHWAELLGAGEVTLWNTVPQLMQMLVEYAEAGDRPLAPSLRLVMMSGDWIPVPLPDRIRRQAPSARLFSLGGATEASIWSILYEIGEVDSKWPSIPYGRPMVNQRFHVLDEALEPCPEWVPGHLYIGGVGLAEGYWRDEEKTAASFFEHPRTGERLYRTGDLGRFLPSGDIEFLGREDFQVKILGHRIELGEIEAAMLEHPRVAKAVVTARGELRGSKRLAAYAVAEGGAGPLCFEEMRAFLATKLPDYMVPADFVELEEMPLSANGKVSRRALPAPDRGPQADPQELDAHTRELAEIFTSVLGLEGVDIHDNFFEMGGDSIQGIQAINRANEAGFEVTPQMLFEHQTIAGLAAALKPKERRRADQGPVIGPVVLAPAQRRLLAGGDHDPPVLEQCQIFEVTVAEPCGVESVRAALGVMAEHHDALRLRLEPRAESWQLSGAAPGGTPELLVAEGDGAAERLRGQLAAPFAPDEPCLWRTGW